VKADDIEEFALPFALGAACATHIFAQEATIVAAVAVGVFAFGGCFLGARLASVVCAVGRALVRRAIGRREP